MKLMQKLLTKGNDFGSTVSLDPISPPVLTSKKSRLSTTVIVIAWNASKTISSCLAAIEQSSFNQEHQGNLEVVVVDDGSTDDTWKIIKEENFSLNLIGVQQKHSGMAQARNIGIGVAGGEIIIFCDADMVLNYYAIEHLILRHEKQPNLLLVGFRTNTSEDDQRIDPDFIRTNGSPLGNFFLGDDRIVFPTAGLPSNMCLATNHFRDFGNFRPLRMPDDDNWYLPDMVFGALFSLPVNIYRQVGGFDERFHGYGCEDGFLGAKAIGADQYIVPIYASSALHVSHPPRSGNSKQIEYLRNRDIFFKLIEESGTDNYFDWISKASERIVETFIHQARSKATTSPKNLGEFNSGKGIADYSRALEKVGLLEK